MEMVLIISKICCIERELRIFFRILVISCSFYHWALSCLLKVFVWVWAHFIWQWPTRKYWRNQILNEATKSAKLWTAGPYKGPMSFFCLICSFSALSPGCYCWCPTNSAPANSSAGRLGLGVPFYLNPHLSCWGRTNWKAVVMALTSLPPQAVASPGGENESVL